MEQTPLTARRWTRKEYERLVELGAFDGEPLELIGGQLIVAEPQGSYHASTIFKVADVIRAALPPGFVVRSQGPIALDDEPEPDVAVVQGTHDDYLLAHPQRPLLVVEVADSSLRFDRRRKQSLYARGGVDDYWIVNLVDRVLEVYRDPAADHAGVYGWQDRSVARLRPRRASRSSRSRPFSSKSTHFFPSAASPSVSLPASSRPRCRDRRSP